MSTGFEAWADDLEALPEALFRGDRLAGQGAIQVGPRYIHCGCAVGLAAQLAGESYEYMTTDSAFDTVQHAYGLSEAEVRKAFHAAVRISSLSAMVKSLRRRAKASREQAAS